jgi:two-component system sensor kinase FixL
MVDGVIMIDSTGLITLFNPACETMFEYSPSEVIGRNIKMLMLEPDRAHHDGYIKNYQTSGDAKVIGIGREVQGRRKSGKVFPMYLSVGENLSADATGYVGIIRDLTEVAARRAEYERLQQEHFHLSRVSAMDQMGAAIAHEINQPLTAIMNYLEAGKAMLSSGQVIDPKLLSLVMDKSAQQARRTAQILSRLRQFIETGDTEKTRVDIQDAVQIAIDLVWPAFKNTEIKLVMTIPKNLPPVQANAVQLQQVFVNLIRNGCEAMAAIEGKVLSITAAKDEKVIKIGISDTGCGLGPEDFDKLYEPFRSSKEGGLGVGLSISRTIIANHNGKLWAEHNKPRGTVFFITLPIGH